MALVSLEQAKRHLRDPLSDDDEDVWTKVEQASAIILDYIARPSDAAWTATIAAWDADTAPAVVQAACLRQVANLYQFRGDDPNNVKDWQAERDGYLSPDVASLLRRYRDPVLA